MPAEVTVAEAVMAEAGAMVVVAIEGELLTQPRLRWINALL